MKALAKSKLEKALQDSGYAQGGYAAALIESAGLKGLTVGGAQVSEKHAGFVVNRGGATAADVLELLRQVQQRVLEHSGIRLEPEIRLWD